MFFFIASNSKMQTKEKGCVKKLKKVKKKSLLMKTVIFWNEQVVVM